MFYLTTHSTHFIYGYMASYIWQYNRPLMKEGRKDMFYLTTHSTHFIYGYMDGWMAMIYLTMHSTHFIYGYMYGWMAMIYLTTHSTHFIYGYMDGWMAMIYLTTHSTHFIYGYMASDIWLRTILIVRKETRCRHIGYSFRLTARVLLYAPSHRQDSTYHGLCYTSRGALAGTRIIVSSVSMF